MMLQESDLPLYSNNCPPGWTRYTAMDGKFPKGAPAGIVTPLNSGGATTHTHTYSQVPAHTHSIAQIDVNHVQQREPQSQLFLHYACIWFRSGDHGQLVIHGQ